MGQRSVYLLLDTSVVDEHVEAGVIGDNSCNQRVAIRLRKLEKSCHQRGCGWGWAVAFTATSARMVLRPGWSAWANGRSEVVLLLLARAAANDCNITARCTLTTRAWLMLTV